MWLEKVQYWPKKKRNQPQNFKMRRIDQKMSIKCAKLQQNSYSGQNRGTSLKNPNAGPQTYLAATDKICTSGVQYKFQYWVQDWVYFVLILGSILGSMFVSILG